MKLLISSFVKIAKKVHIDFILLIFHFVLIVKYSENGQMDFSKAEESLVSFLRTQSKQKQDRIVSIRRHINNAL